MMEAMPPIGIIGWQRGNTQEETQNKKSDFHTRRAQRADGGQLKESFGDRGILRVGSAK